MIFEIKDTASGIKINLLERLEIFTSPEVFHCKSISGIVPLDNIDWMLKYLSPKDKKILKMIAEKDYANSNA